MKKFIISIAMAMMVAIGSIFPASAENVKARLVIDIGPFGVHSWILKGIKDGAFARRGVDVEFVGTGPGSVKTSLAITAGKAELGYHDYSGVVLVNSKLADPKVTVIFVVDDRVQDAVFTLNSSGIKTFDDLNNRSFGGLITGVTAKVLPAVTDAKWKMVNMPFSARVPSLLTGKVDAVEGFTTSMIFNLLRAGATPDKYTVIKLSDKFPRGISRVITVNSDWAAANPKAVVAIREVIRELLADFVKNPAASVAALSGPLVSTDAKRALEVRRAQYGIDELVNTPFVQKNGISNATAVGPRLSEYTSLLVTKLGLPTRHLDYKYFDLD